MLDRPDYSIVIPVCNEQDTLPELARRVGDLLDRLDGPSEVLLVDDGSADESWRLIDELSARDPRFKAIQLSRNFGHQMAITAGMDFATGNAVIIMDADLQDPPEVIVELASRWRDGFDVVYAVREARAGESRFKEFSASAFYRLFRRMTDIDIPVDVGDFRLVDRGALEAFKVMRETNRYVRGMFSWIGFRQTGVHYRRAERFAGRTKYPLRKMLKFAMDGVVSFSNAPLRLALQLGFIVSIASMLFGVAAFVAKLAGLYHVSGLASLVVLTSFLGGIQLVVLGVVGEYIARTYEEVKQRPLYIVRRASGFGSQLRPPLMGSSSAPPLLGVDDPSLVERRS